MICTITFSVIGVYWFFLITGTTFTLMAMIGILILIGVVVNNGIVLIDHVNQLRLQGLSRDEALITAGRERLRPILMTTLTSVFGLLPLLLVPGAGTELYRGLAGVIVGGMLVSAVFTLLLLPALLRSGESESARVKLSAGLSKTS